MANKLFSLSSNLKTGFPEGYNYIVTPNAQKVADSIIDGYRSGVHSYTLIGTYGTGKSSFLIALEEDLRKQGKHKLLKSTKALNDSGVFETIDIIGDYKSLDTLLSEELECVGDEEHIIDHLRSYYNEVKSKGKFLVIFIDEFGKVLEHAAKKNPEGEMYFMQKLAEFINVPTRHVLLITTLHQIFNAYAKGLNQEQRNEWNKVKGRFREIVFVEPVEQLLYLASKQYTSGKPITDEHHFKKLYKLAEKTHFISQAYSLDTARSLYPLDPFAASAITEAIQRYGQNERSLFSFLNARGENSLREFEPGRNLTYNLQEVYDYVVYNFYSYLKDANADSMNWSAMEMAIERVEGTVWDNEQDLLDAIKIVKAIGLLNILGSAAFSMSEEELATYATYAMGVEHAAGIIDKLKHDKIIRFAAYKQRLILFQGTDINIEDELVKAGAELGRQESYITEIGEFFSKKVAPVKAYYYHRGTPRYFEYEVKQEIDDLPVSMEDVDGYIQLIFTTDRDYLQTVKEKSAGCPEAYIFAFFNNTDEITEHIFNIKKYDYILTNRLSDGSDRVAITEVMNLKNYEITLLNKTVNENLFSSNGKVTWVYKGQDEQVSSLRDFNRLLSKVCDDIYSLTPVMNNELFNKNRLSSSISGAKAKYMAALLTNSDKRDFGFEADKFPPEKTIYYSLLKNTGLHVDGHFADKPSNEGIMSLWDASEEFLKSTTTKPRKISELIKKLKTRPYKIKTGFLEFWIPTYLYIKRNDYSLYGANGAYIPLVNMEFFELLQKHPSEFLVKAFDVSGVKMEFFNQYRKYVNLNAVDSIKSDQLIDTIRPFFFFYNKRLNDYAKHTNDLKKETKTFRDVLARAKDPEKTFLEDLPNALGFDINSNSETFAKNYADIINRAVRELRGCYNRMIDNIEVYVVEYLGLDSYDYNEYIDEVRRKFKNIKAYLLNDRLKSFYQALMTERDNRNEWYQAICFVALQHPLERLRDDEKERLHDELLELFSECEKYIDISKISENEDDEIYSFDLVSSNSNEENIKPQTYRLNANDAEKSKAMEEKINSLLSGNKELDVVTLLKVLKNKIE